MIHIDCTCGAAFVIIPSRHVGLKDDMSIEEVLGSMEIRRWPDLLRWRKEHQDCEEGRENAKDSEQGVARHTL